MTEHRAVINAPKPHNGQRTKLYKYTYVAAYIHNYIHVQFMQTKYTKRYTYMDRQVNGQAHYMVIDSCIQSDICLVSHALN